MKSNNLENDEVTRGNSSLTSKSTGASSRSFPSVVECQNDSLFQAAVTKFVNDIIFPRKQFVLLEEELDVEGKLATKCLQEMKLEKSKWSSVKEIVRRRINQKRNNAMTAVKKSLTKYMEVHGVESIQLRRVLLGRRDREAFHWFLDNIAAVVVGLTKFEQVKSTKPPHEWMTPSLEAFCLVCTENFFEMVQKRVSGEDKKATSLWTCDARGKKKNQGWDIQGARRYNNLVKLVRMDRKTFQLEDEMYLNTKMEERNQHLLEKLKKKKENLALKERGWEAAEDDLSEGE